MNKLKSICQIVLFSFVIFSGYGQEDHKITEILNKSNNYYLAQNNKATLLGYKLYSTYDSNFITEKYEGVTINSETGNYLKIHHTEFISNKQMAVKINHEQKAVLVISGNNASVPQNSPLNVKDYFKYFKSRTLKEVGGDWVIEFKTGTLTQFPYGKMKIYIDKVTYKMKKQVLYLLEKVPYTEKGIEKSNTPRLEIEFKEKSISEAECKELFNVNRILVKEGKKYRLLPKYSEYKLIIN